MYRRLFATMGALAVALGLLVGGGSAQPAEAHAGHGHVQNNAGLTAQYRYSLGAGSIYNIAPGTISPNSIDVNFIGGGSTKCVSYKTRTGVTGTVGKGAWSPTLPNVITDITRVWYC